MIMMTKLTLAIAGTLRDPYWRDQFLFYAARKRLDNQLDNLTTATEKLNDATIHASTATQQFADAYGNSPAIGEVCGVPETELTRFADLYPECSSDAQRSEQRAAGIPVADSDGGRCDVDSGAVAGDGC